MSSRDERNGLAQFAVIWVLTETKLSAEILKQSGQSEQCLTQGQAFLAWVRDLAKLAPERFPTAPYLASQSESLAIICQIILEGDAFPLLSEDLKSWRARLPPQVYEIKRFLDRLRSYQLSAMTIGEITDEFGNVALEDQRTEELLLLASWYQDKQRADACFDTLELRSFILDALNEPSLRVLLAEQILPQTIVLERPTHFFPLEMRLWSDLSSLVELKVVVDDVLEQARLASTKPAESKDSSLWYFSEKAEALPPSNRYAFSLISFLKSQLEQGTSLEACSSLHPEREAWVSFLFDGAQVPPADTSGLIAWECEDRRAEVRLALDAIEQGIGAGALNPEQIHIVVLNLEAYSEIFREEIANRDLMISFPYGQSLSMTSAGSFLRSLLRWYLGPSLDSLYHLFTHPFCRGASLEKSGYQALEDLIQDEIGDISKFFQEPKDDSTSFVDLAALSQTAEYLAFDLFAELGDGWQAPFVRFLKQRLKRGEKLMSYRHLLAGLAFVEQERLKAQTMSSDFSVDQTLRKIRREFWSLRVSFPKLKGLLGLKELSEAVRALREVRFTLSFVAKMLSEREEIFSVAEESLGRLFGFIEGELASRRLTTEVDSTVVRVSELLDVRALESQMTFVLGVSEDAFPLREEIPLGINTGVDSLSKTIAGLGGYIGRAFESIWLLSHLMRNSESVVFSYPRHTESGELEPAHFIRELERCLPKEQQELAPASLSAPAKKRLGFLKARFSSDLTEFDGLVSLHPEEGLAKVRAENGCRKYSVSDLELLADCPQAFYFLKVLRIHPPRLSVIADLARISGTIVHQSLADFFSEVQNQELIENEPILAEVRMREIAEAYLSDSDIEWSTHPAFRAQQNRILSGLAEGADARPGMLKEALDYQRRFLDRPELVEYRFGVEGGASALRLEDDSGGFFEISGAIDRVDFFCNSQNEKQISAVWDYKTGRSPSFFDIENCLSLQLALYAAVLQQNIEPHLPPLRGGYIELGRPWNAAEEQEAPRRGVLIEALAFTKRGNKFVFDEQMVLERIERALEKARELDLLVRQGRFIDQPQRKHPATRAFAQVFLPNKSLLERKLGSSSNSKQQVKKPAAQKSPAREQVAVSSSSLVLSAEQEKAAEVTKTLCVVAGAGSGKTAVLRTRILELLLRGKSLQSIVAITFTEKAAAEIRARVETIIRQTIREGHFGGRELSLSEKRHLIESATILGEAQFSTIHSLAARISQLAPERAGIWHYERIVSSGEQRALALRALEETLSARFQGTLQPILESRVDAVLSQGMPYQALVQSLASIILRPHVLEAARESISLDGFSDEPQLERLGELVQHFRQTAEERVCARLRSFFENWARELRTWLSAEQTRNDISTEQERGFIELLDLVQKLSGSLESATTAERQLCFSELKIALEELKGIAKRKSKRHPRNFYKELADEISGLDERVFQLSAVAEISSLELAAKACSLAVLARERYQSIKRQARVVDFDDLIKASYCLTSQHANGDLLSKLKEQVQAILVDEFQDTDELQWSIISRLTELREASENLEQSLAPLFLVGDAKQAIYGFRGGDIRVFKRATSEVFSQGGQQLILKDNYRSSKSIVSFVNEFFEQLFSVDHDSEGKPRIASAVLQEKMIPQRDTSDSEVPGVGILLHPYQTGVASALERETLEAENSARYLAQLVADEVPSSEIQRVRWEHLRSIAEGPKIAVLTRTVRQLLVFAQALEAEGVPFSITHSSGFFELEEISNCEKLFRTFVLPRNEVALLGVLRSVFFGFSDTDLFSLARNLEYRWSRLLAVSPHGLSAPAEPVWQELNRWRAIFGAYLPSQGLARIIEETELASVYRASGHYAAFRNIERFLDLLRAAERDGRVWDLRSAVRWLEEVRFEGAQAPNANSSQETITITTIHGSKGLEFPMVVLPFLDSPRRGRYQEIAVAEVFHPGRGEIETVLGIRVAEESADYRRRKTLVNSMIEESERSLLAAEERRIFYVACTRARDFLLLSLREEKNFLKHQAARQEASWEERKERVFSSRLPGEWLREIGSFSPLEESMRYEVAGLEARIEVQGLNGLE